jgi:hypothetical protein
MLHVLATSTATGSVYVLFSTSGIPEDRPSVCGPGGVAAKLSYSEFGTLTKTRKPPPSCGARHSISAMAKITGPNLLAPNSRLSYSKSSSLAGYCRLMRSNRQCCNGEGESVKGRIWSSDHAVVSPRRHPRNATCPAMSFFANHLTWPFRIMFTVSMP